MSASVPVRRKLFYSTGEIAESIKLYTFEIFLFFYYTQVLGLSGSLAGIALFIALWIDAVTDPVIASFSDNIRSRWGRRHPLMLFSVLPAMVSFYLLFSPPLGISALSLFVWLCVFSVLVRVSMTFFYVPYLALGAELSRDFKERTVLVGYRLGFGVLAGMAVVGLGFTVYFQSSEAFPDGQLNGAAYPAFAQVCAILAGIAMVIAILGTRSCIQERQQSAPLRLRFSPALVWADFARVFGNKLFLCLFISAFFVFVMRSIQSTLGLHVNTFYWQLSTDHIQWVLISGVVGLICGMPFGAWLNMRFERKTIFIAGLLVFILFQNIPITLSLSGLLELDQTQLLIVLLVTGFMSGLGIVQFMIAGTAMFADISDAHELETGQAQQAMFFAGLVFLTKVGTGVGHLLAGVAIDVMDFPVEAIPGEVAAETLVQLAWIYGPAAALIGVLAFWSLSAYSLPKRRVLENQHRLHQQDP